MAELFQRPGSPYWYAWLRDPRHEDGVVKRSTKCRNKAEARRVAQLAEEAIAREIAGEADRLERDAELEARRCGLSWLTAVTLMVEGGYVKDSTADGYASIGEVVHSVLGDFDMGVLDHAMLKTFCSARRQQTVKPPGAKDTGRRVSDQTIRNNLTAISSVYKHAIDFEFPNAPKDNPVRTFDRRFLKASKKVDRHVRPNQFQAVLDACLTDLHRRMLIVLVGTGMRTGEFTSLYWGEVDLKNLVIEFGNIDPDRTKTAKSRRIPMLGPVVAALTAQRAAQIKAGEPVGADDLVFPSPQGGRRYDMKYLTRIARERAGVKGFWVHGLRHTFASWALQQGADEQAIQRVLGHATLSTTQRYAHHVSDSVAARFRTVDLPVTAHFTAQSSGLLGGPDGQESEKESKNN